jgi:hypothetical protein
MFFSSNWIAALIESLGLVPMHDILKKLGGWPVLEGSSWDPSTFNWKESVYRFREYGYSVDYFMDFSVTTDVKNSTYRVIDVSKLKPGLLGEYP